MIKIIEPGNIFKHKCPVCNCLFQYEKEDVTSKRIGRDTYDTIMCPQCGESLMLNVTLEELGAQNV